MNTRKIFWIIIIVVLLLPCVSFAQYNDHRNRKVDSLEQVLATNPPTGVELSKIYGELTWGYKQSDSKKSMNYARKRISLAEKEGYYNALTDSYHDVAMLFYGASQYDSAHFYYEKALVTNGRIQVGERDMQTDIDDNYAQIYSNMGNLYNIQGKYHAAIEYYTKALKIYEKYGWKESLSIIYMNIGEMHKVMDNYEQAEINFTKSHAIGQEIKDSFIIMYADRDLSGLYLIQKNYDKALEKAEAVRRYIFAHPEEGENEKAFAFNLFARIYLEGYNDMGMAENYLKQALQISDSTLITPREKAVSLALLSSIYLQRNEWRKAEQAALEALATDDTVPANTLSLYESLAKAYTKLGDSDKAWEYFDKHNALQASWSNKHYQSAIREMEVKYETEKKETNIAALESEKRLMIWLGIAGGAVLLLALTAFFFLWRWTVQKKRLAESQIKQLEQEKQLIATQAVLDGEVQERTRLARDLHDGLGGLLSAARLQFDEMKKDVALNTEETARYDKAIGMLDESMSEMRRVAHHLMPDALSRFGLKTALTDFCNSIPVAEFIYFGNGQRLDRKMEEVVYRIAHELINNALKHSGASHILVQIVQEADRLALTVEDNGKGFNSEVITAGMGLANVRTRVASFGGTMDMRSSAGSGTETNIEFQLI
jgi:signal transduction histidine kinase